MQEKGSCTFLKMQPEGNHMVLLHHEISLSQKKSLQRSRVIWLWVIVGAANGAIYMLSRTNNRPHKCEPTITQIGLPEQAFFVHNIFIKRKKMQYHT